jgi:hypothetical protein
MSRTRPKQSVLFWRNSPNGFSAALKSDAELNAAVAKLMKISQQKSQPYYEARREELP